MNIFHKIKIHLLAKRLFKKYPFIVFVDIYDTRIYNKNYSFPEFEIRKLENPLSSNITSDIQKGSSASEKVSHLIKGVRELAPHPYSEFSIKSIGVVEFLQINTAENKKE